MNNIINRIAWIVSLIGGFCIFLFIGIFLLNRNFLSEFDWISAAIVSLIFGILIKNSLLSKNYIDSNIKDISINELTEKKTDIQISENISKEEAISSPVIGTERAIIQENIQNKIINEKQNEIVTESSNFIKEFFSVNALAKIGGIFIFLGVVFFLSIFYIAMSPIGKLIMGIVVGAIVFCIGIFMDKKGFESQSRVLMGTGILINYFVILSGRYILGENGFLSEGATFILLILNTILSIFTSLIYKSDILLLFSFIIAYANPFLVGGSSTNPYTLVGYSSAISFGGLYLSMLLDKKLSGKLLYISFFGGNLLFLLAPFTDTLQWIIKLVFISILSGIVLFQVQKKNNIEDSQIFIISSNVVLFLLLVLGNIVLKNGGNTISEINFSIGYLESIAFIISQLLLLIYSYYLSTKDKLGNLYSIGTLFFTLIISSLLQTSGIVFIVSMITIAVFGILNLGYLFWKEDNTKINYINSMLGIVSGAIFIGTYVYNYGSMYLNDTSLGFMVLILGSIYGILGLVLSNKFKINTHNFLDSDKNIQNLIYTFIAILIGYWVIAVAILFAQTPEIIAIIWLIKANLILYVYYRSKDSKVLYMGTIILFIGVAKLISLGVTTGSHTAIIITTIISFISLNFNLKFLENNKEGNRTIHDLLYVVGIFTIWFLLLDVIPNGYSYLGIEVLVTTFLLFALSLVYRFVYIGRISKEVYSGALIFLMGYNAYIFYDLYKYISGFDIEFYTKLILYTLPVLIGLCVYNINRSVNNFLKHYLNLVTYVYLFIITTLFVHVNFNNMFVITIYWGVISFVLLAIGIQYDISYSRTFGLYVLGLTILKVVLMDIWNNIDDPLLRVLALMIVGGLMIGISSMYTKKYGNSIKSELDINNLYKKD